MDAIAKKIGSLRLSTRSWLLLGLGLVFLRAIPNLRFPIGRDQATYCVIGRGLLQGQLLYRDLWDNKPPGIFYVYSLIVKVFGPVMWAVGVVDILWLLVISVCIFYFAKRYIGAPAATLAVVFNAVRHCRQGYIDAVQPEAFITLFVFLAYFLLLPGRPRLRLRYLAAGLMLAAAFWIKYNAAVFFPVVVLLPFLDFSGLDRQLKRVHLSVPWKEWFSRMLVVGLGFGMALAIVVGYFYMSGAWPAMKEVQFEVLPRYAEAIHWDAYFILWGLRQTSLHLGVWTEAMVAFTLVIAWMRKELSAVAPILLMALASYGAVAVEGRFHFYYFEVCFPFFYMLWGYVCVRVYQGVRAAQQYCTRRGWKLARVVLWVLLADLVFALLPEESVRIAQQYKFLADWWRNPEQSYAEYWWQLPIEKLPDQLKVINYLKENSTPKDEVYIWGTAPLVYFLAQRQCPSRFVSNLGVISTWVPDRWRQELVRDLKTKRPRYIVVARHDPIPMVSRIYKDSEQYLWSDYPALAALIRNRYEPAVNYTDFEVYRLK
jgi:hypothetical protein